METAGYDSSRPLAEQVAQRIKDYILEEKLKSGDKLPTETALAREMGVARSTVREAIKRLESQNILTVRHGAGSFVTDQPGLADDPLGLDFIEDKERLAFCDQMTCRAIDASAYIGAKYAVIHPQRDAEKHTLIDRTVALLTPFNEYAKARGVTLCVENMYTTYPEELREIVDRMACGACWDVGHANFGKHPQYEGMTLLGKRIRVLHLHDNYGTRDDHSMPYFGTIDWDEIMRALRDIGYEGTFNYEVAATHLPMALREDHARYLVDAAKLLLGR